MAKKFKVMASNAKKKAKSDGSCIPKSMRKDVKSGCTKKSVKASDTAKKFRVDIYKRDNPDALVKREVKTFNSEDEAKKYGESIANGGIVNVIEVKASCTKKSVKASKSNSMNNTMYMVSGHLVSGPKIKYFCWTDLPISDVRLYTRQNEFIGECDVEECDIADAFSKENRNQPIYELYEGYDRISGLPHIWDRVVDRNDFQAKFDISPKNSVKSSKSLTVPKSIRRSVKASSDGWKETDYSVFMDGGRQLMSKYTKEFDGYRVMILPEYNAKTDILSWVVFLFDVDEEPRRLEAFETAYDAKDFADYEVYEGYVKPVDSSKSVKKFEVKASATAKRIAKSRITASDNYYDEDIVFYWNGKKQFEGRIFDLADTVEILCHDPKVMEVFQDYCNQFGDPFDFDGTPRDTATIFTKMVMFEAEEANDPSDFYVQYSDYRNPTGGFEIFYKSDENIESAKSIKAGINAPDTEGPLCVCEYCLEAIESHEGRQVVYDEISEFDIEPEDKLICDWCEEESDRLYQISPDEVNSAKSIKCSSSDAVERAKQIITDNYNAEYGESATVEEFFKDEDLNKVGILYTTFGDENEYDFQISVDLNDPKVIVEVDNEVAYEEPYSNMDALIEDLQDFDWNDWYSYYIHKLPEKYDEVIFSSCANGAKSIKCSSSDNYNDLDEIMRFRVCSYYDTKFRDLAECKVFDDFDEAVDYAHECLGNGPTTIEDYYVGTVEIDPDEYWENFDGEFWCTPELAEWRDEVWKSMGIGASKSIKCNDGIAPDDYDSIEDLVPEAYALSGGEDDDMLEYVDDYIATEGCPATVNFVTYNTPNDWSVDVSKYGEAVVSDFIWYLEEVASELSDKFYDYPSYEDDTTRNAFKGTKYEEGGKYATFYGDNALVANDYEFQFYPAQNQWSAPQIEFDIDELKLIGFTDDEIGKLMQIYEDYKTAWIENCKYINAHIGEFLADLESNVNASTNIKAGITVGQDDRYDFSNPIYELDDYVKAIADGVVNQIQGITYDISKETIAFFDDDNNVVFVQPIGGIIPEPDDLETDIDELSAAIKSEMDNAYARDNWESDEDDSDYASRAVELSEDIGEVDIDDLEPITGDGDDEDIDYGFGFDSNGEALDESTVEELYRIAEYEILPKSELAKIDEYVSIDEDSWDFYMSSPHVTEKFYIHFKLTEKDIDFNKYALPEATAFPDFNYYTAVLDFDIYTENGEVTSVVLEEVKINRPDGAFDDYDVKRFDKLYNVDAIINYVEALAADTVMDIYNGTTNL